MTDVAARLAPALADRYRLARELGQGGMATVYLAEDVKHGRKVAIKVLHPELSAVIGGERFLAEIRTTAQLQHPHILGLIDSGAADGLLYYVMPFVSGESLRARLEREKQLPVEDALRLAKEVAGALDHAHRQGVVHRDIKPENILLQDGSALVADFGIALAVQHAGGSRMTQTGLSLGTPAYMSPEQAMGEREITARSDVYALGAMTYEMLAGEPPFTGSSAQAIVARVLTEEPPRILPRRRTVPPHVEAAVLRALQKLPADRYGTAGEFARALDDTSQQSPASHARTIALAAATPRARATALLPWAVAAAGLALGAWGLLGRGTAPEVPPSILTIESSTNASSVAGIARQLDISRDGRVVAFQSPDASSQTPWMLQALDQEAPTPLPGSGGFVDLRLSPDGRTALVGKMGSATGALLPLSGGSATPVSGHPMSPYVAWQSDGTLWLNDALSLQLLRVATDGTVDSTPVPGLTGLHIVQSILPGDRHALTIRFEQQNEGIPELLDLRNGTTRPVLDHPVLEVRYAAGHLVFVRLDGGLHAVPFDPGTGRVTGRPVQIGRDVALTGATISQFAVAENGTVVYARQQPAELVEVALDGTARLLAEERRNYHSPSYSPDGRTIAVDFPAGDGRDVWTVDREDGSLSRVTSVGDGHDPVWQRDGRIAFTSIRDTFRVLAVRPGDRRIDTLVASSALTWTGRALADGGRIATGAAAAGHGQVVRVDPQGRITPLAPSGFDEGWPAPSPDGRWVALASTLSGRPEVYVMPADGEGQQVRISQRGGTEPVWSPDGRHLYYISLEDGRRTLVRATLAIGTPIRVGERATLFPADAFASAQPHANYDIAPDGSRFVFARRGATSQLVVIQGLPALVRARGVSAEPGR